MSVRFALGTVELGVPLPERRRRKELNALEKTALELPIGGSFLVSPSGPTTRKSLAVEVAALISLARGRGIHLRYRSQGESIRIWRCAPFTSDESP